MAKRTLTIALIACSLTLASSLARAADNDQLRSVFKEAQEALERGQWSTFGALKTQLSHYVLLPYLEYFEQRQRIRRNHNPDVTGFAQRHPDFALNSHLQRYWLDQLAARADWRQFLENYHPDVADTALQCHYLRATPDWSDADLRLARDIWMSGKSQPRACDPAFARLQKHNRLTSSDYLERIRLAMGNGKTSLASYLARFLPAAQRDLVEQWVRMDRRPARELRDDRRPADSPLARDMIAHGLIRLARNDAPTAQARWEALQTAYAFTAQERASVQERIAISGATQFVPDSYQWFSAGGSTPVSDSGYEWRTRAALRQQNWPQVLDAIVGMPAHLQRETEWQYWRGRALAETHEVDSADQLFRRLSETRSYYGFLAADLLQQTPRMNHTPLDADARILETYVHNKHLSAARELVALNMSHHARREWQLALDSFDHAMKRNAAYLAHQWGWHHIAIRTLYEAGAMDDTEVRFPTPYREQVVAAATDFGIDPAWVYGIIRKESAFNEAAVSSAGARGLMQLLPATGRQTARRIKAHLNNAGQLHNADLNIKLGSAYLSEVANTFDGHQILATAAYNAGPHRVKSWLPDDAQMPADVWIETIPFRETRNYAQSVTAFTSVFQWRLNRVPGPLREIMRVVEPPPQQLAARD